MCTVTEPYDGEEFIGYKIVRKRVVDEKVEYISVYTGQVYNGPVGRVDKENLVGLTYYSWLILEYWDDNHNGKTAAYKHDQEAIDDCISSGYPMTVVKVRLTGNLHHGEPIGRVVLGENIEVIGEIFTNF